jgi:hypothetical protein
MLTRAQLALVVILASGTLGGCDGRTALRLPVRDGGASPDGGTLVSASQCPAGTEPRVVELNTPVKLDLLFMIDDSRSMAEEQTNLARNFPRLIDELEKLPTGFPDLHLGVVSSDLGAGSGNRLVCDKEMGDRGVMQGAGCGLGGEHYLISEGRGTRTNFSGDIAQVFSCMAGLGTQGCGFEHQLQSVRMALSGFVAENTGFLRPDAHLAVVYITDEDDCSAPAETTLFDDNVSTQDSSLRCSVYGHLCDGSHVPTSVFVTPLDHCTADPKGGGKLIPVQVFVDEMKRLRTQSVSVTVIGGWPTDPTNALYAVGYDPESVYGDRLASIPICSSKNGKAAVGLRLKQFVDAFGPAGKILSICQDDFSDAMAEVGQLINRTVECR